MTVPQSIVLATRRSALALAQSRAFSAELTRRWPSLRVDELQVVTTGDRITNVPLADIGGKGLFIKEIEEALQAGRAQFAVHSFKDVPTPIAAAFTIACVPRRADPRDVLVGPAHAPQVTLATLPTGAKVGTSSLRRAVQVSQLRPDVAVVPLRGNVDTRLRKVDAGEMDAIILARAGLLRLGLERRASEILAPDVMIPAPGQGALAVECRAGDEDTQKILAPLTDMETTLAVTCERGVMAALGADCNVPFGAHARREGTQISVTAFYKHPGASDLARAHRRTPWPDSISAAEAIGTQMGLELRDGRGPI